MGERIDAAYLSPNVAQADEVREWVLLQKGY
jgi:hypothetical protein